MYGRRGYPPRDPVSPRPQKTEKELPPTDVGDKNSIKP